MRRFLKALSVAAMLLGPSSMARAQGIPVIDSASLTQQIQQVVQMAADYKAQIEQLTQLQQQYINMVARLKAMTGTKDFSAILGQLGASPSLPHAQIDTMIADTINGKLTGPLAASVTNWQNTFGISSLNTLLASKKPTERAAAQYAGVASVTIATGEAGHAQAKEVSTRADTLRAEVGKQDDLKAAVDYNTLVLTEIVKNQSAIIQLLSANVVNQGAGELISAQGAIQNQTLRLTNAPK